MVTPPTTMQTTGNNDGIQISYKYTFAQKVPLLYGEVHIPTLAQRMKAEFPDMRVLIKGKPAEEGATIEINTGTVLVFVSQQSKVAVTVTNGPPVRVNVKGSEDSCRSRAFACIRSACISIGEPVGVFDRTKTDSERCHDVYGCIDI
jgi:hypothetical protein